MTRIYVPHLVVILSLTAFFVAPPGMPSARAETTAQQMPGQLMTELGTIDFPNGGSTAAQPAFLTGVKALYSFQFDEAGDDFRVAQLADPDFALAYWGEAMSLNHPLWAEQDFDGAHKILNQFASSPQARAEKTPAGRERGLMAAVDVLYGPAPDKLDRDRAYAETMRGLHEAYPDDNEIATLYALALLGTVRPGDTGIGRQMHAAAIAQAVFAKNPKHPGAAHFIIHALDDPEHAILALPAARAYAGIAPDAPHALHMPSHIFVQLGLWEDVVTSNAVSYKAAIAIAERQNMERGRSEFHSLSWMHYGQLQLGDFDAAEQSLDMARETERISPTDRVHAGVMAMLARAVIETERWGDVAEITLEARDSSNVDLQFAVGLSAAKRGDMTAAEQAATHLKAARERSEARSGGAYRAKIIAVSEKEIRAAMAVAAGDPAGAEALLQGAIAIETTLNAPSGPPQPMKPSFEMYGEFLLDAGRLNEAAVQFETALQRTPNRTISVQGLSRAQPQRADASASP
jgi:hypothetical protein